MSEPALVPSEPALARIVIEPPHRAPAAPPRWIRQATISGVQAGLRAGAMASAQLADALADLSRRVDR